VNGKLLAVRTPARLEAFRRSLQTWPRVYWAWLGLGVVSALAAVALLRADWIPWSAKGAYSDLAITHWPNAVFVQNALRETGRLPFWRPLIMAGTPFAANPLSGLWYPPNVLLLFLPLPAAFNLLLALHLFWGGLGMYELGRGLNLSPGAALVAAVAWTLTPKTIAHLGAGHFGLVCALGWLPWVVWAARWAGQTGRWQVGMVAGAALAVQFLADPRIAALTVPVAVASALVRRRTEDEGANPFARRSPFPVSMAVSGGLAFLVLTAVQTLPLAEFMAYSTRAMLTPAEAGWSSLPWRYLLGVILPDRGGFHEWMTYVGPAVLILAVLGLSVLGRRAWLVLAGLGLAVLFALGMNTPFYRLLVRLVPGLTWLRVPARAWVIVAFGLALLAGLGVAGLQRRGRPGRWLTPGRSAALALALVIVDLGLMDASLIRLRPVASAIGEDADLIAYLASRPSLFRVYSPSYSLPQQTGALYGLQTVDGVDPLQLAETVAFVQRAAGLESQPPRYSEVLPPAPPSGDVIMGHRDARPNLELLGLLNVRYLAAEFPLDSQGGDLVELARFGTTYVYENMRALPRAFIVSRAEPVNGPGEALARLAEADARAVAFIEGGPPLFLSPGRGEEGGEVNPPTFAEASVVSYAPDRILIQAVLDQPGVLVLSEVWYPGWHAQVDGRPADIFRADGLLRAIYLQAGAHTVEFSYDPWTVKVGLGVSTLGWVALVVIIKRETSNVKRAT